MTVEQVGTMIGMPVGWLLSSDVAPPLPSRTQLCRMRFIADCAFCLLMKEWWADILALAASGTEFMICLLADSSPRVGNIGYWPKCLYARMTR